MYSSNNPKIPHSRVLDLEDTLIIGGGPIGSLLALILHERGLRSVVLDARKPNAPLIDRTLALSWLTVQTLLQYQIIQLSDLTPIYHIQIGQAEGTQAWTGFSLRAEEAGIDALGYTLSYTTLQSRCDQALARANIPLHYETAVRRIQKSGSWGFAFDEHEHIWSARAVVLAEGGHLKPEGWIYEERPIAHYAWIASLPIDTQGTAYERFTESGVLAFLPSQQQSSTLIFSQNQNQYQSWCKLNRIEHNQWLAQHLPASLEWSSEWIFKAAIPLRFQALRSRINPPIWAIGNAAQIIHPVAGLGFNLGVRDVLDTVTGLHNYFRPTLSKNIRSSFFQGREFDRRYIQSLSQKLAELGTPQTTLDKLLRQTSLKVASKQAWVRSLLLQSLIWGF